MLQSKTKIGSRDEKITIEEGTTTKDNFGQMVPVWSEFATVWAKVDDRSGGEGLKADQITAYMNTTFNVRYLIGVNEKMRILRIRTGRYYDIRSIKYPDRKLSLDLSGEMLDDPVTTAADAGGAFSSAFSSAYST